MGGDAQIIFKWFVLDKNNFETSILGDSYQFNLNDIEFKIGVERNYIRFKIKKREEQNKFNTRKDTTVDLFSDTNLDNNNITPVSVNTTVFKEKDLDAEQSYIYSSSNNTPFLDPNRGGGFLFSQFMASYNKDDVNLIPEQGTIGGFINLVTSTSFPVIGLLRPSTSTYSELSVQLLSMLIEVESNVNNPLDYEHFELRVYRLASDFSVIEFQTLETSVLISSLGVNKTVIDVTNSTYKLNFEVQPNETLRLYCTSNNLLLDTEARINFNESSSVKLKSQTPIIAREINGVRLFDGIDQICKLYTDSKISLNSNILSINGRYYNNYIYTGIGLRGVIFDSLKTNFESLFENGVSKIMALGYDLRNETLKIEDINFFFKDVEIFDFTNRDFERDSFLLKQYNEIHFNTLLTGYKKFSTEEEEDLFNFNTKAELTTPIISLKKKLDIESETVTDSSKIQELINDSSTSTNEGDDDVIMVDVVNIDNFQDTGSISSVDHINVGGNLVLEQFVTTWTSFPITIGGQIEIIDPINQGVYIILNIETYKLTLQGIGSITQGDRTTSFRLFLGNITKNRTSEGFDILTGVNDPETSSNVIHNPKYQLFRWYPLWGSGLTKKDLNTEIIVNDYKNNGNVTVKVNTTEFPNEYPNEITLDQNFTQTDLQNAGLFPLFNGNHIEVKIHNVDFFEFFEIFNNWRYGFNNDDNTSFGYLTVPTPYGSKKIFPFGDEAFNHNRGENTLIIKGLEKYES